MVLVSACLCGINCKYNGGNNLNEVVRNLLISGEAIPVCPEQLGGQCTPRIAYEIGMGSGSDVLDKNSKVLSLNGKDVTNEFIKGAMEVLKIAKDMNIKYAILKARSPSCGVGTIYDGSFTGKLKEGNGVTTELLKRNGIKVYTEENFNENLFCRESI